MIDKLRAPSGTQACILMTDLTSWVLSGWEYIGLDNNRGFVWVMKK